MTERVDADPERLFPADLEELEWMQFPAAGFASPVCGVVYSSDRPPCCGVPLGGISTGCLDVDARGVFGYSSLFNPSSTHVHHAEDGWRMPRQLPGLDPMLGLNIGGTTWVLASGEMLEGGQMSWCTDPQLAEPRGKEVPTSVVEAAPVTGVSAARGIKYWGHYPVADMAFDLDGPVAVEMRAWAPFIPGDEGASNIPAAVFEVHLRNASSEPVEGSLALNFPGPSAGEARSSEFVREQVDEDVTGVLVTSLGGVSYLLAAMGEADARVGASLGRDGEAWSRLGEELPQPTYRETSDAVVCPEGGAAAAVDFSLQPGEARVVRFLLTWFAPLVEGARRARQPASNLGAEGTLRTWVGEEKVGAEHCFTQMYASRYSSALDVARRMCTEHETLLQRVLSWQERVYGDERYPVWLRDSLVNNLALIAEDSHWFQPRSPLGDWVYPGGGFALNESPRGCPQMSCIPCDFYGNLPIVLFFPDLARQNLRLFKEYQLESGEVPFALGKIGELPDMASPSYQWQVSLNGACYVVMVDRVWLRTGDDEVLTEFYESVKKCNTFTMDLKKGPGGPISMPDVGGMEWFEFGEWAGMCSHMGGMRLAQLRMVERMAQARGDTEYVEQCQEWLAEGSRAMEEDLWAETYYLNFWDKETGKRSDDVMAYQLDGEWAARHHGLGGVFRADRVPIALDKIRQCNVALTPEVGAANFTRPDGSPLPGDSAVAHYGLYAMFPPELVILAMTYMYAGDREFGLDLARRHWENLVLRQRHPWDLPNIVRGDTGVRIFGTDYYQNMVLWAMVAACDGNSLEESVAANELVGRMLEPTGRE